MNLDQLNYILRKVFEENDNKKINENHVVEYLMKHYVITESQAETIAHHMLLVSKQLIILSNIKLKENETI